MLYVLTVSLACLVPWHYVPLRTHRLSQYGGLQQSRQPQQQVRTTRDPLFSAFLLWRDERFPMCSIHDWFHAARPVALHAIVLLAAASVSEMLCVYTPPGDLDLPQTMGQQTEEVLISGSTLMGRVGDPRTVEGLRGRMLALAPVDPADGQLRVQAAFFLPTPCGTRFV
jgi:hypothetical protein